MNSGRPSKKIVSMVVASAVAALAAPLALCDSSVAVTYPTYTAQSIVHTATQLPQALAPNTLATIYGSNLSFDTMSASTLGATLPIQLDGVAVFVGGWYAYLLYVSPTQINFLVPYNLIAGPTTIAVTRDGAAGPVIPIQLNSAAPGLFVYNGFVIATHLNGTLVSAASPAVGGEIIVLYLSSLGRVTPDTEPGQITRQASSIANPSQLQVLFNGTACPPGSVLYAGLAPGFAGLYQINMTVPPLTPHNPEIRISLATDISPSGVFLAVQ